MIMKYAVKQVLLILLCSTAALTLRAQATFRIFDKPIIFDAERKQLSLEYLEKRHGLKQNEPTIKPVMVVLHWTAIPSIEVTFDVFNKSKLPGARKEIATASALNVSSQFLVDRDGTVFRLLPDTVFARHVIGLNYCAIGVENIGSEKNPLTPAQLVANEQLIRYLKRKYPIEYVIGHYEYTLFKHTPLWKETDPAYSTHKTDPGIDFMKRLREQIKDLNIKGAPGHN
ncbi:N-acetylmuramoyl-L-alanine amidase [Pedobacter nyackensis]|uniref:N-acetylmuramoyl-L-alanine amidase n=2 Tax=Pedobacter nyackensis TaxID=475255 RepID=A0A1W2E6A6_9SPHI|nr:N-acetylmuramoyl-L-alanine amidase [Pedobacter nyackensis]